MGGRQYPPGSEDEKRVRDIRIEELSWHKFKILFRKKYLSKR